MFPILSITWTQKKEPHFVFCKYKKKERVVFYTMKNQKKYKLIKVMLCIALLINVVSFTNQPKRKANAKEIKISNVFVLNGGTLSNYVLSSNSEGTVKLPTSTCITRKDFAFNGWYDNKKFTGSPIKEVKYTALEKGLKFYAKWVAIPLSRETSVVTQIEEYNEKTFFKLSSGSSIEITDCIQTIDTVKYLITKDDTKISLNSTLNLEIIKDVTVIGDCYSIRTSDNKIHLIIDNRVDPYTNTSKSRKVFLKWKHVKKAKRYIIKKKKGKKYKKIKVIKAKKKKYKITVKINANTKFKILAQKKHKKKWKTIKIIKKTIKY